MAPTKILVIEDDLHSREIIQKVLTRDITLRHLDISVVTAADGDEGIAQFKQHHPELVITDLLMPRVDGFEAIEAIRADPAGVETPILVITAVYRDTAALGKLEQQQGIYLQPKPFMPQVLAKKVHQILRSHGVARPQPTAAQAPIIPPPPATPPTAPAVKKSGAEKQAAEPPEALPTSGGATSGDLSTRGLPLVLLDVLERELNGSLDLRRGKVRKVLYVMAGHPIFVQSNLRSETLGQMLVRRGGLSQDQHAQALSDSKEHGIKYGEALVRLGYLTEGEVMDELLAQTRLKLEACLAWKEGSWDYAEDMEVGNKVPRCVLDPVELVFKGLLEHSNPEEAFLRVARHSGEAAHFLPRFALYRERFIELHGDLLLSAVTPERSIGEVVKAAGAAAAVVQQLDLLLRLELVECRKLASSPAVDVPLVRPRPARFPLEDLPVPEPAFVDEVPPEAWEESSAVIWMGPDDRPKAGVPPNQARPQASTAEVKLALQLIQSIYLGLHDSNHYQVLGVTENTDPDSIEVAHEIKRKQFDLSNFSHMDLGEHYGHLEEICTALDRAHACLSDPDRRAEYDTTINATSTRTIRNAALGAEALCRQGEELLAAEAYEGAEQSFAEAVQLDDQAEYRAKHALAIFLLAKAKPGQTGELAAEAMLEVQEALSSDPGDLTTHLVAAQISRGMGHEVEALQTLRELLKTNPDCTEAVDTAAALLRERGEFEELEILLRRTIHVLGNRDSAIAADLWRRLALLYREDLKDPDKFRTACKVALQLYPEDRELRSMLAEMDRRSPERWPEAVLGYRSLLKSAPGDSAPIHQLFQLHEEAGRADAAYVAATAAELRGEVIEAERTFLETHRPRFLKRAVTPLGPALMESLRHADDEPGLATLFRIIAPVVQQMHPLHIADLGLDQEDLVAQDKLPEAFASVLRYAAAQLGEELPVVAARDDLESDIQSAGTDPPLILVGSAALASVDRLELCFRIGRALRLLGPGRRLAAWRPRRILRSYILAAMGATYPEIELPDPEGEVQRLRKHLESTDMYIAIKGSVTNLRERFKTLNLSDWQRGIKRTADRVGLLLCTDLKVAGAILAAEGTDAEADLVDFALSETYGELRTSLGLALD